MIRSQIGGDIFAYGGRCARKRRNASDFRSVVETPIQQEPGTQNLSQNAENLSHRASLDPQKNLITRFQP
jgi:hypothetical protein